MLRFYHYQEVHDVTDKQLADYYYNIHFSNESLFENLPAEMFTHADFFEPGYGQINDYERAFLYNFVKKIAPERGVMEFSSATGASTSVIGKAIDTLQKKPHYFETHEIIQSEADYTRHHLNATGVQFPVKIVLGDVFEKLDRDKLAMCDFLFIDSDHRAEFCQRYAKQFLPLLKDCWVGVHDILMEGHFTNPESFIIRDYVQDNGIKDYFLVTDVLKHHKIPNPFRPWAQNPSFYFKVP